MSHFRIRCRECGKVLEHAYCAFCEHCIGALLVTEFLDERFRQDAGGKGIWRFNWLPVHNPKSEVAAPLVYRSQGLAKTLGLDELYIAFNGYWPQRGALVQTCTFKEFEAAAVLENARENDIEGLVVASAGNTARAFAHLSALTGFPSIIIVPHMCTNEMWALATSNSAPLLVLQDGDYSDCIDLARRIAQVADMPFEGGVKNIAKRDGLGVVMLEAVAHIGRLPQHYVQAVGSGAGAIAAWEMSERFQHDPAYRGTLPKLHLAQNLPFAPMYKAWKANTRTIPQEELDPALICQISTRVLSSRYPAYGIKGGIYDALSKAGGDMYGVQNDEMQSALELFEHTEGVDIVPAAAVAVAALRQAISAGSIKPHESVLLNITGGGEALVRAQGMARPVHGIPVYMDSTDQQLKELSCKALNRAC